MSSYLDTSALAKWYLDEAGSPEFAAFVVDAADLWISRLTVVELRCLLARRRRAGLIDGAYEGLAYGRFVEQMAAGYLLLLPVTDELLAEALGVIERLIDVPLRTLDAIHLAAATAAGCTSLATGDRVMHAAARELGFSVAFFGAAAS